MQPRRTCRTATPLVATLLAGWAVAAAGVSNQIWATSYETSSNPFTTFAEPTKERAKFPLYCTRGLGFGAMYRPDNINGQVQWTYGEWGNVGLRDLGDDYFNWWDNQYAIDTLTGILRFNWDDCSDSAHWDLYQGDTEVATQVMVMHNMFGLPESKKDTHSPLTSKLWKRFEEPIYSRVIQALKGELSPIIDFWPTKMKSFDKIALEQYMSHLYNDVRPCEGFGECHDQSLPFEERHWDLMATTIGRTLGGAFQQIMRTKGTLKRVTATSYAPYGSAYASCTLELDANAMRHPNFYNQTRIYWDNNPRDPHRDNKGIKEFDFDFENTNLGYKEPAARFLNLFRAIADAMQMTVRLEVFGEEPNDIDRLMAGTLAFGNAISKALTVEYDRATRHFETIQRWPHSHYNNTIFNDYGWFEHS